MNTRETLSVDKLRPDPMQSRDQAWTGNEADQQLAASIDTQGIYQDIIVRPIDDVELRVPADERENIVEGDDLGLEEKDELYTIIAGSRRYHAAIEAGKEEIPCKVVTVDDLDAAWASLLENTERSDLSEQEIANQLNIIYELIRPKDDTDGVPKEIGDSDDLSEIDVDRCETKKEALRYIAENYLGRTDDAAIDLIRGHLRTANLPPILQSLFKQPDERSNQEQNTLRNYDIDTRSVMGSGEGKSGTSREIVSLHKTLQTELDTDEVDATSAVLETVGSLRQDSMSEQQFRCSLRDFRNELVDELDTVDVDDQRQMLRDILTEHAQELRQLHEEIEPERPFQRIDVMGPETQRHSRWHVKAMHDRQIDSHSELVSELYTERLEELADERGWS